MASISNQQSYIIRTERGLAIAGTRLTLYDIMDYLAVQYPPKLIRDIFNLTDEQINTALVYIETHQAEVEAEYQEVLQTAEEIKQYWENKNREHFSQIAETPANSEYEAVRAKLQEHRAKREAKKQ